MATINGKIYLTTNSINGKIYIGQTITNNSQYLGSGAKFKKELKKYGRENFTKIILLDKISDTRMLRLWEEFYIALFNATNPEIGYNLFLHGCGHFHTEESKQKIKNRSNQEDNKIRIRTIQKLASQKRIGMHHSKKSIYQMLITKFEKIKEINIYNKSGELIHTCNTAKEASLYTGVKRSAIANNLCGISKSTEKFIFKHKQ